MNLCKYFLASALMMSLVSMTTGCSIFGGEKDTIEISPSPVTQSAFPLSQLWSNSLSGNTKIYSQLSPAVNNNVVYAAGRKGQVKAIDLFTGKTLWNIDLSTSSFFRSQSALLSGGVSVDDKHVYLGSESANLYTLDKNNGSVIWQEMAKGEILAKPLASENKVIIRTTNGYLQAFEQDSGNLVWELQMDDEPTLSLRGQSTPAAAYGAIILGDDSGHVNAYFIKDGQLIWQQRISQPSGSTEIAKLNDVDSTPVIEKGLVYAIGYNGNIAALDLSNGQVVWKKALSSTHSFVLDKDHIFAVDQDDNLYALSKNGGSILWKQSDLLHRQLTNPIIYQDYVVVGDFEGYLYLVDINSGDIISKTQVSSSGLASDPVVADNKIIIQAKNGNVYTFGQK
ncbi:outer membrane protein assembly factor BamB [Orbus sturtevantii]|uniref:outer membrane protein assembly factor BamB n=1 Tax=Orbus sturtevantii TaxID=3074109 RepID=UPI00370D0ACB